MTASTQQEHEALNRFQLLALDVDGTLVGESLVISGRLQETLSRAKHRGIRICLCTGRPLAATERYRRALGVTTPPVVFNGALVPSLVENQPPLVCQPLKVEAIQSLVDQAMACGDYLELHAATTCYISREGPEAEFQREKLGITPVLGFESDDGLVWERERLLKAQFVIHGREQVERLLEWETTVSKALVLSWAVSPAYDGHFVNVMRPGVDKASSLEVLLGTLGIPWERVFAAGDSLSDLAYVQRAGCGLIMGDAAEAVRVQAPHVCLPVEQDGLARAIEEYVLA